MPFVRCVKRLHNNFAPRLTTSYSNNINSTVLGDTGECPKDPTCTTFSRYRSPDGTCNNLAFPQVSLAAFALSKENRMTYFLSSGAKRSRPTIAF